MRVSIRNIAVRAAWVLGAVGILVSCGVLYSTTVSPTYVPSFGLVLITACTLLALFVWPVTALVTFLEKHWDSDLVLTRRSVGVADHVEASVPKAVVNE